MSHRELFFINLRNVFIHFKKALEMQDQIMNANSPKDDIMDEKMQRAMNHIANDESRDINKGAGGRKNVLQKRNILNSIKN